MLFVLHFFVLKAAFVKVYFTMSHDFFTIIVRLEIFDCVVVTVVDVAAMVEVVACSLRVSFS